MASPAHPGEWAFRASVLGCEGAISGHLYLDERGRAAYIADGEQVVGRGVGRWLRADDGSAAAVELDIFQYAAAAVTVPEAPHRFRGVWEPRPEGAAGVLRGDWYFCPDGGGEPRLVGAFDAAAAASDLPGVAIADGPAPRVRASARDAAMAALDARKALRSSDAAAPDQRLAPFAVGDVTSVYYIPDWIEASQEAEFINIADGEMSNWETMSTRSTQEWGAGDRCACGRGLRRETLPPALQRMAQALHHLGIFDGSLFPMNSVRINAYRPGQGIYPHCDGPVYYPKIAILSLSSPCIMHLYPKSGTEDSLKWDAQHDVPGGHRVGDKPLCSILLEPRSLVVFNRDAFWHHRHGIKAVAEEVVPPTVCNLHALEGRYRVGDVLRRSRRVSLTMRHLLPRCACQG